MLTALIISSLQMLQWDI